MKRKRRKHSAGFKAKMTLAALPGDRSLAQLAEQFVSTRTRSMTGRKGF